MQGSVLVRPGRGWGSLREESPVASRPSGPVLLPCFEGQRPRSAGGRTRLAFPGLRARTEACTGPSSPFAFPRPPSLLPASLQTGVAGPYPFSLPSPPRKRATGLALGQRSPLRAKQGSEAHPKLFLYNIKGTGRGSSPLPFLRLPTTSSLALLQSPSFSPPHQQHRFKLTLKAESEGEDGTGTLYIYGWVGEGIFSLSFRGTTGRERNLTDAQRSSCFTPRSKRVPGI